MVMKWKWVSADRIRSTNRNIKHLTGPFDVGSEVVCTITTFDGRESERKVQRK